MPSTVVFPGGAVDESDYSVDYAAAYKRIVNDKAANEFEIIFDVETSGRPKAPAYEALRPAARSSNGVKMPPEWIFRVCALRELFEECGILIGYCLNKRQYVALDGNEKALGTSQSDWNNWRQRVRESGEQFQRFSIEHLNVVPAFWLLDDWSNWLAPSTYKAKSRFDTIFYLCCLDEMPEAVVNVDELESGEWINPAELLAGSNVSLAPPQRYELSRLSKFHSMADLRSFSSNRKTRGLIRYFPQLASSNDGKRLCLLQGDDLYSSSMKEEACDIPVLHFEESASQLRSRSQNLHRGEFDFVNGEWRNAKFYVSVPSPCGHVGPVCA